MLRLVHEVAREAEDKANLRSTRSASPLTLHHDFCHGSASHGTTDSLYCFTSKRLAADQLPAAPEDELARTRHHIVVVGSVPVVNCETVVVWFTICGVANELSLSIWIV